jgi:hypothetical protein
MSGSINQYRETASPVELGIVERKECSTISNVITSESGIQGLPHGVGVTREIAGMLGYGDTPRDVDPRREHDNAVEGLPREEALQHGCDSG